MTERRDKTGCPGIVYGSAPEIATRFDSGAVERLALQGKTEEAQALKDAQWKRAERVVDAGGIICLSDLIASCEAVHARARAGGER